MDLEHEDQGQNHRLRLFEPRRYVSLSPEVPHLHFLAIFLMCQNFSAGVCGIIRTTGLEVISNSADYLRECTLTGRSRSLSILVLRTNSSFFQRLPPTLSCGPPPSKQSQFSAYLYLPYDRFGNASEALDRQMITHPGQSAHALVHMVLVKSALM